jgi:hypothetical protein
LQAVEGVAGGVLALWPQDKQQWLVKYHVEPLT